jgi:UDP-N-acetylglucosamine 2-epimerase
VTGNARLDDLTATARSLTTEDLARARASAGAGPADALVLVTTKWKEAQWVLPALLQALARVEHVHLAIKTHPAETPEVYDAAVRGLEHVRVLPASAALAPLLAASRAVVTVNSTVALDAAVLGLPALVAGLPNNLSPFVEAGVMVGVSPEDAADALRRILYDQKFRHQLNIRRQYYLSRFQIRSDGQAAERTADAVLRLVDGMAPAARR